MRPQRIRTLCVVLAMAILSDAMFLRSALIVAHDHWFGADGVGAAVDDAEPQPRDDQPILHEGSHGTLVAMALGEQQRPRPVLLSPSPVSDAYSIGATPVTPGVVPSPGGVEAWVRAPGLDCTVLRI